MTIDEWLMALASMDNPAMSMHGENLVTRLLSMCETNRDLVKRIKELEAERSK